MMLITGILFMCLVNLSTESCRRKTQLVAFDVTGQVPKSPLGLQQCERECFSDQSCQVMVYNVNNLACYKEKSTGSGVAAGGSSFVVKLRSEVASNLDTSYLCRNHQCENGLSCVVLSSGDSVCAAGLCGQPVPITNAVVNVDSYSIFSIAQYSCITGYYSIGTSARICSSSLEWSGATLVCCKQGFEYDQKTQLMFKVIDQKKNYTEALGHCASLGAGLAKIDTIEKRNVFQKYLSVESLLTDLNDRDTEGTWIHSDGNVADMSLFVPYEPNGGTTENCAIVTPTYQYNDIPCKIAYYFICEVK